MPNASNSLEGDFIVSRDYRAMKVRPTSARSIRDTHLIKVIREIQARIYSVFGYRKRWHALVVWDWDVSRDYVVRLMRAAVLKGVIRDANRKRPV